MLFSRYNNLRSVNKELLLIDDPLLFYERSIAQHVEMSQTIYELLELTILEFKDDKRYKNSLRYLRLWLMYVLYLNTPHFILPILCLLIDNHIGDKLATLYEVIAYYQFKENKLKEAEATLFLGLKNNAQPIKSLERVLYQFHNENSITFDTKDYSLIRYNIDYNNNSLKYPTLKSQLDWMDVKLQHYIRTGILRECCHNEYTSFEELRATYITPRHTTHGHFHDIKKDIENVYNKIKNKHLLSSLTKAEQTIISLEQTKVAIPTKSVNVVQLPYSDGFIQNQIRKCGLNKHDSYYYTYDTTAPKSYRGNIFLGENQYHVVNKIGQGGMAHIYLLQKTNALSFYGVKVQQPPHPWEYYILYQMHTRKRQQHNTILRVLHIYQFHHYIDTSYLIMSHLQHGTLLDALNLYRKNNSPSMPEPIALLFILELLQQINGLHDIQISHNDLKLDNIMLTTRANTNELPGLIMIDFGRSVDLSQFDQATYYKANWPPVCIQSDFPLLNEKYDPIHADYWQIATIAHLLLFGTPMKYTKRNNHYSIQNTIRRYWNKSLWITFFETMLNPKDDTSIQNLIQEFEQKRHDVPENLIINLINLLPPFIIGSDNL